MFRITVGVVLLRLPALHHAPAWARLPDRVRTPPLGLEWTLGRLPMGPDVAEPLYWIVVGAIVLGVLGLATRAAWSVVALGSLWLLAIPQYAGSVFHYHHLLWFAALLAVSPSGDALSIDRWIARRRGEPEPPSRSLAYGVPIRAAWLLIGVIFFFPGLHKLLVSGWAWIWSDNLRNQMYAKWLQMAGFTPLFRVDRYPLLVRLGALGTVAFELSFIALALFRRTRLVAVAIALAFHQATAYLMGLRFPALWLCYVVFVDWAALSARVRRWRGREADEEPTIERRAPWPALSLSVLLLAGSAAYGALGISDAWPFACYPKFAHLIDARLPALRVELVYPGGRVERVPVEAMNAGGATQRWWAVTWSVMGSHRRARAEPARWAAFWRTVARRPAVRALAEGAIAVRFHRDLVSTVPEARDAPPLASRLLYELPLRSN